MDPVEFDIIKFNIDFELRPLSDRGLIIFIGRRDFISIFIQSGLLELRILPSKLFKSRRSILIIVLGYFILGRHKVFLSDVLAIRSNKLLVVGAWHKISVGMYGRKVYMFVDGIVSTGVLNNGDILNLSGETIYLGKNFNYQTSFFD